MTGQRVDVGDQPLKDKATRLYSVDTSVVRLTMRLVGVRFRTKVSKWRVHVPAALSLTGSSETCSPGVMGR